MRVARLLAAVAAAALACTGCTGEPPVTPTGAATIASDPSPGYTGPCLPPPFTLSSATVKPGGTVTVTANDSTCHPRYGQEAQIEISVMNVKMVEIFHGLGPMSDDGGFTFELALPRTVEPGEATVTARPYDLDWCDDTGGNNRLNGAESPDPDLERVDCINPVQPLRIEP